MSRNVAVASGLVALIGACGSIPYLIRKSQPETHLQKEKLTGSQRQRGMYMNAGSHDAGPDPDYDATTGTWKGYRELKHYKGKRTE